MQPDFTVFTVLLIAVIPHVRREPSFAHRIFCVSQGIGWGPKVRSEDALVNIEWGFWRLFRSSISRKKTNKIKWKWATFRFFAPICPRGKLPKYHTPSAHALSLPEQLLPFITDDLYNPKEGDRSPLISSLWTSSGCLAARSKLAHFARAHNHPHRHRHGPGPARLAETSAPLDWFNKICSRSSL